MSGLSGNEWAEVKAVLIGIVTMYGPDEQREDSHAETPPEWATWPEYGMCGDQCGMCGAWCEIVRPGKTQCHTCHSADCTALAIRVSRLLDKLSNSPALPHHGSGGTSPPPDNRTPQQRAADRAFMDAELMRRFDGKQPTFDEMISAMAEIEAPMLSALPNQEWTP